ncbi:alpha/beta hydrolase [Streptomyces sp. ME19-01-6]|uniref:alpha/beta hydrolase n=1 Tax=Streptomyces sp. ME19-01-6 TaxID=3028686 RepID=UPI0029B888F0|nr:alpha/beta hydrolase [Streptomyces sp. ME19-01-6]MDX3224364.1 alpha/beta hydrolase [Streptomyces sp. ME19-01-6]
MDYSTLKSLKPSEFEGAAGGYRTVGDMASQAKDDIEQQVTAGMRKSLKGKAVDEAVRKLQKLAANFQYTQVECGLITTALNSLAYELRAAKNKLDAAVEDAAAAQFTVHSDGSVSYPPAGDKVDGKVPGGGTVKGVASGETRNPIDPAGDAKDTAEALERQASNLQDNPNYDRALAIANRIAQAVHQATRADEKWAPELRKLKADDDLVVAAEDWADAKRDMGGVRRGAKKYLDAIKAPLKDSNPEENATWWKSLSKNEQDACLALDPAGIGKRDGLPAAVRDEANRTVLAESRAELSLKLDEFEKEHPEPRKYEQKWDNIGQVPIQGEKQLTPAWQAWNRERSRFSEPLKGIEAIQRRFDKTGEDGLPEAYLLGFSPEGRGRAIVANGNPDDADHIAVYTPGTGASLSNSNGDINRGVNLWKTSQQLTDQEVSTVTWIGYDAPPEVFPEATQDKYADNAAGAYGQFIDGLNAANKSGSDAHITAIAHSYGTTVIGAAANEGDLGVDDIVFAGSPGARVENAEDLDVSKGHVWNEHAKGDDLVNGFGRFGHGGGVSGVDPTDPVFGANQMATDTEGHSGYWDYDDDKNAPSLSIKNQGSVIVGEYDKVQMKPRDDGSLLPVDWREPPNWGI